MIITPSDSFASGAVKYKDGTCDGAKLADKKSEPRTMSCFVTSAEQQIKLFHHLYGNGRKKGRIGTIMKFVKLREAKPVLFAVNFIVSTWNRIRAEFGDAVREGVRALLRVIPEGANSDALATLALSPQKRSQHRIWRWPNVISFSSSLGMWQCRILPELEGDSDHARIRSAKMGEMASDIHILPPIENRRNRRPVRERNGNGGNMPLAPPIANVSTPKQDLPIAKKNGYPLGKKAQSSRIR